MRTTKKLLPLLLAVCFICILHPETASADTGSIMVNGSNILQAQDYTISCGSGTAKYNPDTKTLTLDNASIAAADTGNVLTYGIEIQEQGVTVELIGQNSIDAHLGIFSSSPFQLKGTGGGSLAIHASQAPGLGSIALCGIRINNGGLAIQDARLQITVGDLQQDNSAYAIYICGGENKISNSQIEISMPTSFGQYAQSTGINATDATSLTISDNSSITMNPVDAGISITGTLKISGSKLAVPSAKQYVLSCGNLEIVNGSDVNVYANTGLALSASKNITVSASTVNATSVKSNSLLCANLSVTDNSTLIAKGYWPAFFVKNDTVINNSSIKSESTNDVSIYCPNGNLEITDSDVTCASAPNYKGIFVQTGNLTMTDSNVVSPANSGVSGIHANGDIIISGGTTEIGAGGISSKSNIQIGGVVTANGKPSYENITSNNANGQVSFLDADYTAVDEAIARANMLDKGGYINFDTVKKAINAVVRGKDIREQDVVDEYAAKIEAAIAALKPSISILEGADQTIAAGTDTDVTIRADGDFDKFVSVLVDGTELAKEHYAATSGSTVITFKPDYIKTLAVGNHAVAIRFTDGQAQTTLTIQEKKQPENPDEKPEQPGETPGDTDDKPEQPGENPGDTDDKPEQPGENPGDTDDKPEQPGENPGEPDDKPEQPGENPGGTDDKPEQPSDKPNNPDGTPDDASPNGQPQKPSDGSSNETAQKPSNAPAQNQGNDKLPPKTGDHAPIGWLTILMVASATWLAMEKRRAGSCH